jgi:flagellar motility protein MotE (MotC chaperone)
MGKWKKMIIMAAAGLVSFAGAFVFAWLTCPSPADHPNPPEKGALAAAQTQEGKPLPEPGLTDADDSGAGPMRKVLTEQQLKNLIQDVREKMRTYDNKLQTLTVEERRLQMAQDMLKEDIENLNSLRVELAATVVNLKNERDKLLKSRLEIDQAEKANLVSIAATYDKMESSSAGKILTNMCAAGGQTQGAESGQVRGGYDDAVKILYYMTERTKAKVLAELATSEPALAAALCQRLKQIVEGT